MNPSNIIQTLLTIVFSTLCFFLQGQSFDLEEVTEDLRSENIITTKGREHLITLLSEHREMSASTILSGLGAIYGSEFLHRSNLYPVFKKMKEARDNSAALPASEQIEPNFEEPMVTTDAELEGKEIVRGMMSLPIMANKEIEHPGAIAENQSVFGRNLISLSDKLVKIGLISLDLKEEFISIIKDEMIPENMMLTYYAFSVEELERQPSKLREVLTMKENWVKNGILIKSTAIDDDELREVFDLVKYSPYGIELRRDALSQDAKEGYGEICAKISVLTGMTMELSQFDIILKEDILWSSSSLDLVALIALKHDGKIYRDTFSYDYVNENHPIEEGRKTSFTPSLIKIFNKILKDANVCSRLYYINAGESGYSSDKVGLMFLDKDHYFSVKKTSKTYFIFGPHPEQSLNACSTERLIDEAIEIGLILTPPNQDVMEESESLVEAIVKSINSNFAPFYRIDGLTNEMILSLLTKNSDGSINFSNLHSEEMANDSLTFSFVYDGVTHLQKLSTQRLYDYSLVKYLKKILIFREDAPQFYSVSKNMEDFGMTYLTIEQKEWIEKNGYNFRTSRFGKTR